MKQFYVKVLSITNSFSCKCFLSVTVFNLPAIPALLACLIFFLKYFSWALTQKHIFKQCTPNVSRFGKANFTESFRGNYATCGREAACSALYNVSGN